MPLTRPSALKRVTGAGVVAQAARCRQYYRNMSVSLFSLRQMTSIRTRRHTGSQRKKSNHSMKAAKNHLMNSTPTDGIVKGKLMEGIFLGKTDGINSSLTSLHNERESVSSESQRNPQMLHDTDPPATNGHPSHPDGNECMSSNGEIPNGIPKANGPEHIISLPPPGARNQIATSTGIEHSHHGKGHHFRHNRVHSNSAPPGSPHTPINNNGGNWADIGWAMLLTRRHCSTIKPIIYTRSGKSLSDTSCVFSGFTPSNCASAASSTYFGSSSCFNEQNIQGISHTPIL